MFYKSLRLMQNLNHPALSECPKVWSLSSVSQLRQFTFAIDDVEKSQLVLDVFDAFERQVIPNIAQFSSGLYFRLFPLSVVTVTVIMV